MWLADRTVWVLVHIAAVRVAQSLAAQVVGEAGVGSVVLDKVRVVDIEAKRIARNLVLVLVGNRQVPVLHDFSVHERVRRGGHVAWQALWLVHWFFVVVKRQALRLLVASLPLNFATIGRGLP